MAGNSMPGRPATGFRPNPGTRHPGGPTTGGNPVIAGNPGPGGTVPPGGAVGPGGNLGSDGNFGPGGMPRPGGGADHPRPNPAHRETEELWAMLSYLGAIFLGPFAPLVVFLSKRRSSPFIRAHATQALNVTLTCTLYAVSGLIAGALLALDSPSAALSVILPIATVGWLIMLVQLIRGGMAAGRGEFREIPHWINSQLVH